MGENQTTELHICMRQDWPARALRRDVWWGGQEQEERKRAERGNVKENTLNWRQRQMEESVEVSTTALLA